MRTFCYPVPREHDHKLRPVAEFLKVHHAFLMIPSLTLLYQKKDRAMESAELCNDLLSDSLLVKLLEIISIWLKNRLHSL